MRSRSAIVLLLFLACGVALAGPERQAAISPSSGGPGEASTPDFTLPALDGQPVSLSQYLGKKPVLLVFWATWCPECKAAIPEINSLYGGPLSGKLQILGVDYRESREKVSAAVKSRDIRYTVLLDEKGTVAREYGVIGIPTYILIGKDGKVTYREHALPPDLSPYL